jgi:hypothetical protein
MDELFAMILFIFFLNNYLCEKAREDNICENNLTESSSQAKSPSGQFDIHHTNLIKCVMMSAEENKIRL